MLDSSRLRHHKYLFLLGFVLIAIFLIYVFLSNHKEKLEIIDFDAFEKAGFDKSQIDKLSHDDDMWYFDGISTCVGYSDDPKTKCSKYESVCAGDEIYGTLEEQAEEIAKAIQHNGTHPNCPITIVGAN